MKTSQSLIRVVAIGFVACVITLSSCKKKKSEDVEPDPDLSTERDISNSDNDQNSLLRDIDKVYDGGASASLREDAFGYATILRKDLDTTIEGITYDKFVKLTYTGNPGDDGQSRSGEVSIFNKGNREAGNFQAHASFSRTKVGGRTVVGTKKITQQASNDATKWQFAIEANGTITTIEGKSITYSSNRTRVRSGINTPDISDDSFTITGSWVGTNGKGESVSAIISTPLQLAYSCNYFREITAGKIDFTNNSKGVTRSVNYGSGGCDGKGTFINSKGKAFEFYFKR